MDYDKLPISSSGCKGQQTSLPAHGPSYLSPSLISVSSFSPSLSSSPPHRDPQNRKAQDLRVSVLLGRAALATDFFLTRFASTFMKLSKSTLPSPSAFASLPATFLRLPLRLNLTPEIPSPFSRSHHKAYHLWPLCFMLM